MKEVRCELRTYVTDLVGRGKETARAEFGKASSEALEWKNWRKSREAWARHESYF